MIEQFKQLKKLSKFETEENILEFENLLYKISQNKKTLENLFNLFDDNTLFSEVMYNVVHVVEDYPDNEYYPVLLKNLKHFINCSPEWLLRLIYGIFNNKEYFKIFKTDMYIAPKETLLQLFDLMDQESPHHQKLTQELRQELDKQK